MKFFLKYSLFFQCFCFSILFAGEIPADSVKKIIIPTTQKPLRQSDVDTTISYEAKDIINRIKEKKSVFIGDAVVKYKSITLKAARITINWDKHLMTAESMQDTIWTKKDSSGTDSVMTVKTIGAPVLIESGSEMTGEKMLYNYKSEKGRVIRGRTEMEGGRYVGRQIKRVGKNIFNVSNSSFTTCDLDTNPHFHFEARRLKMITNDKVIAKPVVFYIGHIPLAALPFAVFPNKSGRQSGIIMPRYGESLREGRYLRELGYYWAPNDYFDARTTVDFFEKTGWLFRSGANYNVRYKMNGTISGSMTRKKFSETYKSRRWDVRVRHNQVIDQTSRISASGYFVSDNSFYRDLSTNLNTRLTREVRSNATYSKSWPKHKLSMSINLSRVQDLQDDVTQQTFPQLSFRKGQSLVFPLKKDKKKGRRKRGWSKRQKSHWYNSLYFSYNSTMLNSRREYLKRTSLDTTKQVERKRHLSHNLNFSLTSPKKYLGWLSLNQSLVIRDDWFNAIQDFVLDPATNQINSDKKNGFAARHIFSYNASANTKLYGMFTPGIADIQAIRHVVTPSFSFRYQPDFSDPKWGYYVEVMDTTGNKIKKDRFGGTPRGGSQSINASVRNLFQMKRGYGEKEKKVDLFTMDFNSGYNFNAKKFPFSDLRTSWRANPVRNFSLSASTTHSFYQWDAATRSRASDYLFKDGGWKKARFARLTNFRLNFSIRLQGKKEKKNPGEKQEPEYLNDGTEVFPEDEADMNVLEDDLTQQTDRFQSERAFRSFNIPWRVNLNFNFSLNKSRDPDHPVKRYYLDVTGAQVNLTPNWRISYSAHYDLEKRVVTHHRFTFYRKLHCWEAQVDWVPSGISKSVYFRINIKAPALRDIKLERRGGRAGMLGY
ncbi:MAG: hypothetical protein GWP06_00795 [Actinobacteria bacterium]|nr:hypothetical protein [Actinomycetota bacterium]